MFTKFRLTKVYNHRDYYFPFITPPLKKFTQLPHLEFRVALQFESWSAHILILHMGGVTSMYVWVYMWSTHTTSGWY